MLKKLVASMLAIILVLQPVLPALSYEYYLDEAKEEMNENGDEFYYETPKEGYEVYFDDITTDDASDVEEEVEDEFLEFENMAPLSARVTVLYGGYFVGGNHFDVEFLRHGESAQITISDIPEGYNFSHWTWTNHNSTASIIFDNECSQTAIFTLSITTALNVFPVYITPNFVAGTPSPTPRCLVNEAIDAVTELLNANSELNPLIIPLSVSNNVTLPQRTRVIDYVLNTFRNLPGVDESIVIDFTAMPQISAVVDGNAYLLSRYFLPDEEMSLNIFPSSAPWQLRTILRPHRIYIQFAPELDLSYNTMNSLSDALEINNRLNVPFEFAASQFQQGILRVPYREEFLELVMAQLRIDHNIDDSINLNFLGDGGRLVSIRRINDTSVGVHGHVTWTSTNAAGTHFHRWDPLRIQVSNPNTMEFPGDRIISVASLIVDISPTTSVTPDPPGDDDEVPVVISPESIAAIETFLTNNTPENRLSITVDENATEVQILAVITQQLQTIQGLDEDVVVNVNRQENTVFYTDRVENVTVTLTVNPTHSFLNQTIYLNRTTTPPDDDNSGNNNSGDGNNNNNNNQNPPNVRPPGGGVTTPGPGDTPGAPGGTPSPYPPGTTPSAGPALPQTGVTVTSTVLLGLGMSAVGTVVAASKKRK